MRIFDTSNRCNKLIPHKFFENQKKCHDKAVELLEQFQPFIDVNNHVKELKERAETRRAVRAMLELMSKSLEYIREHTSSGIIGAF